MPPLPPPPPLHHPCPVPTTIFIPLLLTVRHTTKCLLWCRVWRQPWSGSSALPERRILRTTQPPKRSCPSPACRQRIPQQAQQRMLPWRRVGWQGQATTRCRRLTGDSRPSCKARRLQRQQRRWGRAERHGHDSNTRRQRPRQHIQRQLRQQQGPPRHSHLGRFLRRCNARQYRKITKHLHHTGRPPLPPDPVAMGGRRRRPAHGTTNILNVSGGRSSYCGDDKKIMSIYAQ
mmetsp:Transcript_25583/g.71491  ORF Transcript_25583/g.71491 Transcript_25583/m.71491 type:complete len:232 (+) Transcript_25583:360-1055(+)